MKPSFDYRRVVDLGPWNFMVADAEFGSFNHLTTNTRGSFPKSTLILLTDYVIKDNCVPQRKREKTKYPKTSAFEL